MKDFPTEVVSTYYIPPIPKNLSRVRKSVISRGKLVDKYRNKLSQLKRLRVNNPLTEITNQPTESSDDEGTRLFSENNVHLKIYCILNGYIFMILQILFVKLKDGLKAILHHGKLLLANGNLLLNIGTKL